MRVLISGAGIAGLSAAVALRREGHEVVVVERAPALTEVGAAIVLGPHAMKVLDALGAADHIRQTNTPPERSIYHDMISGEPRVRNQFGETGRKLYGAALYSAHRRDVVDALAGQLGNVEVRLNSPIVGVEHDDCSAAVLLADGERITGDVLVGADGLRSMTRATLFGADEAKFTGFLAWRTVMPMEALGRKLAPESRMWMGAGRHVNSYPIRKGTQFYAAFYVPAEEVHREDWSISGDIADLRASFADACDDVRELTCAISEAFITSIYYRDPLPRWHEGRIVLVGDAAHPVLPTSGSGAAVAIEDSVALAACLRRHGADYHGAFSEFEARRKPRTTRLLISSRADLTTYHEVNPLKIAAAGPMNRAIMRLDPTGFQRLAWLYAYNEVEESAKGFEGFKQGSVIRPRRAEAQRAFVLWAGAIRPEDSIDGWVSERAAFDRFTARTFPWPGDAAVEEVDCDGVPALRVMPAGRQGGPAAFHLHGGLYTFGTAAGAVAYAARLARAVGGWALVPDFRRVPEHAPLVMQEDIGKAYAWLARETPDILLSGEGSGAALAVTLARALRAQGRDLPLALYLLSPFLDPTLSAASIDENAQTEAWLNRRRLLLAAGAYIQDHDAQEPSVSPTCGDLKGLPPMRIFAAQQEALRDDARLLAERAEAAGLDVSLTLVPDSVHSFAMFDFLPETGEFIARIRADATARLNAS